MAAQSKSISLEQICYGRSQGVAVKSAENVVFFGPQSLFFPSKVLKLTI